MPLNTEHFTVIAGSVAPPPEPGEFLVPAQEHHHEEGYRAAELVRSMYGWSVRAASGLDGWRILYTPDQSGEDRGLKDALAWGQVWVDEDYAHREFFYRNSDVREHEAEWQAAHEVMADYRVANIGSRHITRAFFTLHAALEYRA